jgi:rhodanese-related sulfurtransferase
MSTLIPIDPKTLASRLKAGDIRLVDIREPDEFAREHVAQAVSVPLSNLEAAHLELRSDIPVAFTCKTGMRTGSHCARLAAHVGEPAYVLQGGLDAWKGAGLPVAANRKAPLEIQRQVQIAAGGLALTGAILAATVHPAFIALSGFIGAGLLFAGASGWCGMAKLLAIAPWNSRAA